MKLELTKPSVCPPEGFRYVFPETGFVCHDWTYNDWVARARAHLHANGLPEPADLESLMQDQLCQTLEPGWCMYDNPNRPRVSTSLTWQDVMSGLDAFARLLAGGLKVVDQQEAERRAQICTRCYMNTHVQGCASCQKLVAEVSGNLTTKSDPALKSCAVCKCFLRAKVHFPLDALKKGADTLQEVYRQIPHCWLNRESPNYNGNS